MCHGLPSGHNNSHLSHVQNIFLHFQDPQEVSCYYGFRLRLKVKGLPSKSGLDTKEAPQNQFLGCSSLSFLIYQPDTHPHHHRRTGTFKAFPSVGKWETLRSMAVLDSNQVSLSGPVALFLWLLLPTPWTLGSAL